MCIRDRASAAKKKPKAASAAKASQAKTKPKAASAGAEQALSLIHISEPTRPY
mgnify:CR=1 FL=1